MPQTPSHVRAPALALLLLAVGAASACKPSDEPRRTRAFDILGGAAAVGREPAPEAIPTATESDRSADALPMIKAAIASDANPAGIAPPSTAPLDAPSDVGTPEDAGPDAAAADGAVRGESAADPLVLDPALLAALAKPVGNAAQAKARDLNKSGLAHQRRRALTEAVADYEAALAAWPASAFARYNLACARALSGDADAAIGALAVLEHQAAIDPSASDRLRLARADKDFETLREDPRFRRLTGATDIIVAWVPGADGAPAAKARAKQIVDTLREAKWPAKVAPEAWNRMRPALAVEVRADDPIAMRAASEVAGVLGIAQADSRTDWPSEAPPLVVFIGSESPGEEAGDAQVAREEREALAREPEAAPHPADGGERAGAASELADFVGHVLRASVGGAEETLELRSTGFFTWQRAESDDARRIRTGRWKADGETLDFTYKETREHRAEPGKKPRVEALGEHRETLAWSIHHGVLVVGGASFRGGEP